MVRYVINGGRAMNFVRLGSVLGAMLLLIASAAIAGPREDAAAAMARHDYRQAMELYLPAARHGDAVAQYNVALMLDEGWGVSQNYQQALKWYLRAANGGLLQAQRVAGYYYRWGRGRHQDVVRAHMWFNLAAAGGLRHADVERDEEQRQMSGAQVAEAQRLAARWLAGHPRLRNCPDRRCRRPGWLPQHDWNKPLNW